MKENDAAWGKFARSKARLITFPLGQVTATLAAFEAMQWQGICPMELIRRHASGDWGEVMNDRGRERNNINSKTGLEVVSGYVFSVKNIYIVTKADRSATTIMLLEEL